MREYKKTLGFEEGGPVPLPSYLRGRNDYRKDPDNDKNKEPDDDADDKPGYIQRAIRAISGAIPQKDRYPGVQKGPISTIGIRG